jgi:hypothetical protein
MALLDEVKQSLRITNTASDVEILDLIEQAKVDMSISGVKMVDETNAAIKRAIKTFCKANFGLNNEDSEKYQDSYDIQVIKLSLCSDYNSGDAYVIQ